MNLAENLAGLDDVEVISFKKIYPEFLYPGGTKDTNLQTIKDPRIRIRDFLTWYNPIGWIYAGFSIKGKIVHAQWWTHVLTPVYLVVLSIAKFFLRKKIILTVHNVKPHEQGLVKDLANKSVFKLANHFIVHTEDNKRVFSKSYNIPKRKVGVIPLGVLMPDTPKQNISKTAAREKLDLPKASKIILFFGIIREYKGIDTLLEAFTKVHKQVSEAQLVIAGKPWESWEKYQQIIEKHSLQSSVRADLSFIPESEIEVYFKAADLVVLPYRHFDSQSAAGALALPFGKAMVVTSVGGLKELVKDKEAISRPEDPETLADKIINIINNKTLRDKLEKDSLEITKNLSWGEIGKKTSALYEKLAKN